MPTVSVTKDFLVFESLLTADFDLTETSPEAKASSLLDILPGNSLVSKTGWVTLGTGLSALAISKELYVANEETVILVGFLIFATLVGRSITGPYKEWADGQIEVGIKLDEQHSKWPCD